MIIVHWAGRAGMIGTGAAIRQAASRQLGPAPDAAKSRLLIVEPIQPFFHGLDFSGRNHVALISHNGFRIDALWDRIF